MWGPLIQVALCIGVEHDPWLVALAVIICSVGAFSIVQMFECARGTSGVHRIGWAFLTAVASGATIWCTHFVAMLAFKPQVPVTLDPVLTILSLIVAVAGTFAGIGIAVRGERAIYGTIGGGIFGAAISAMHYAGMTAYRVDGIVSWDARFVLASVVFAVTLGGAAFTLLRSATAGRHRLAWSTALIILSIASLHFIAMTAMEITPLSLSETPLDKSELRALAAATALVGAVVITAGIFAALIDRQTRSEAMRDLAHMALNDSLTQLPNRAGLRKALASLLAEARARGNRVGFCAIDLDRFKDINDLHGHKAGDDVLIILSDRLKAALGDGQVLARPGGDEFVALTPFTDREQLAAFADAIHALIKAPVQIGQSEARIEASIGVAVYPDDAQDAETLANNAGLALYRAKNEATPGPCYYDPRLDEAIRDRRELVSDLRHAIERAELTVLYQVQTNIATGAVSGFEALLRWDHPARGPIAPSLFISLAEDNGVIVKLGEWVLRRACADAAQWDHQTKVAVNVSPLQLAHADLSNLIEQILVETGLPPQRLEIELTETAIMADRERALDVLRRIKALGIGVALDDFGTGYSSLQTLRAFPFDRIKLDRFFASELEGSPQSTAIIRAVLALGKSLSIPVLAEGVETAEQLDILLREGCDEVQGFLLGHPQPQASASQKPNIRDAA
jgi:diguanylate cyclase (GGDEF)-like protein